MVNRGGPSVEPSATRILTVLICDKHLWQTLEDGQTIWYSGLEWNHERIVGFTTHKDKLHSIINCKPINSTVISIRILEHTTNIPIKQEYTPFYKYDKLEMYTFSES